MTISKIGLTSEDNEISRFFKQRRIFFFFGNQFESHENFKQDSEARSIKNKRQIKKEINRQITGCG